MSFTAQKCFLLRALPVIVDFVVVYFLLLQLLFRFPNVKFFVLSRKHFLSTTHFKSPYTGTLLQTWHTIKLLRQLSRFILSVYKIGGCKFSCQNKTKMPNVGPKVRLNYFCSNTAEKSCVFMILTMSSAVLLLEINS